MVELTYNQGNVIPDQVLDKLNRKGGKMTDYTKPFPCGECGQMVMATEKHTYKDCQKWKRKIRDSHIKGKKEE